MSVTENKELIRRHDEECVSSVASAEMRPWFDKYYGPGFVCHLASRDENREQQLQMWLSVPGEYHDFRYDIDDLVAEGDKVTSRHTVQATYKGKRIVVKGVAIFRIAGGKIVEIWDFPDDLGFMTQTGLIPSAAPK